VTGKLAGGWVFEMSLGKKEREREREIGFGRWVEKERSKR
jgi:hypothetical protein